MQLALRPYVTTGVAIVGATAIAVAPIAPITHLPDISIPAAATTISHAVNLTAFPQDLIDLVNGLVAALGPAAVTDIINNFDPAALTNFVSVVQGGLLDLAPVVNTLLYGLNNILQTVFTGLVNVVNALTNNQGLQGVLLGLGAGLGIVVNAIFGGLNGSPLADAIAGAIGNLFGGMAPVAPLAAVKPLAAAAPAVAGPAALVPSLQSLNRSATLAAQSQPQDPPPTGASVSGVASDPATQNPSEVLSAVNANLPEQANGQNGLTNAIAQQSGTTGDTQTAPQQKAAASSGNRGSASASPTGKANRDHSQPRSRASGTS